MYGKSRSPDPMREDLKSELDSNPPLREALSRIENAESRAGVIDQDLAEARAYANKKEAKR